MDPLAGASFLTLLSSNPSNAQSARRYLPLPAVLVRQENTPLAPNHHARHRVFHRLAPDWPRVPGGSEQDPVSMASPATCLLRWEASEARA